MPLSSLVLQARRATQRSVKFIRWIRQSLRDQVTETPPWLDSANYTRCCELTASTPMHALVYGLAHGGPGKVVKSHKYYVDVLPSARASQSFPRSNSPALREFPLGPGGRRHRSEPGDEVQWELLDRGELRLVRLTTPPPSAKSKAKK